MFFSLCFCTLSSDRYHQFLGRHIYSAHQQRAEPHPVHPNHAAFQRDHSTGVGQLQTEKASAQRPPASSSITHVAGNVAPAGKQPRRRSGAPIGYDRHSGKAHPRGESR